MCTSDVGLGGVVCDPFDALFLSFSLEMFVCFLLGQLVLYLTLLLSFLRVLNAYELSKKETKEKPTHTLAVTTRQSKFK